VKQGRVPENPETKREVSPTLLGPPVWVKLDKSETLLMVKNSDVEDATSC
jgi:hypothetical protein